VGPKHRGDQQQGNGRERDDASERLVRFGQEEEAAEESQRIAPEKQRKP
jgi:hypothetical protein